MSDKKFASLLRMNDLKLEMVDKMLEKPLYGDVLALAETMIAEEREKIEVILQRKAFKGGAYVGEKSIEFLQEFLRRLEA